MAIWQYPFQAVPKKSVQNEFGELPSHLQIEKEGEWINIVDTSRFWKTSTIKPLSIIASVDKLLPKETWTSQMDSIGWKGNTENKEDNDCWLSYQDDRVTAFSFRVDMRDLKNLKNFLIPILEICEQNDLILILEGQKVVESKLDEIKPIIMASKAFIYVQDPKIFFENLSNNKQYEESGDINNDRTPN